MTIDEKTHHSWHKARFRVMLDINVQVTWQNRFADIQIENIFYTPVSQSLCFL